MPFLGASALLPHPYGIAAALAREDDGGSRNQDALAPRIARSFLPQQAGPAGSFFKKGACLHGKGPFLLIFPSP